MSKSKKTKKPEKILKPVARTSNGLRGALFDEIDGLRDGTSTSGRANSVAKLATTIVDSVRMDMEAERGIRGTLGQIDALKQPGRSLKLAS